MLLPQRHFERHFTVEEANALLPELREILAALTDARGAVIVAWEGAVPAFQAARQNGGGRGASRYLGRVRRLNHQLKRLLELGVQLKDLEQGLIDFPAIRNGEEVLLCWRLGEEQVSYWHTLQSGFAGRRPL